MSKREHSQLADALQNKVLVRLNRPFEADLASGYVLDIGPRFFLLALVSDGIWFNGFQCFRLADVRDLQVPHENAPFVQAALKKRGEQILKKPDVNLASIEELLLSANKLFKLLTLHREEADPDICVIGRIVGVGNGFVKLHEINPDATWEKEPTNYRLHEITRVDFGGDYEDALHLVGGGRFAH